MEPPVAHQQRSITDNRVGNNSIFHQGDNTGTINFNLPQQPARLVIRNIPYPPNEELVNRPDLVKKLNTLLPQTPKRPYCSAALWGLGGSGKTQIALNYAYQRCTNGDCSVFWVHADTEATFAQDYKTIAREFNIDQSLKSEDLFAAVRDHIAALPDWVLVVDNADDLKLFGVDQVSEAKSLSAYIPVAPIGTVLWTSRDAHIAGTLVARRRGINVDRMSHEEAKELLATIRDEETNGEEAEIDALLKELQWLPLAITQAGAYMRRMLISVKKYLSLLAESKRRWAVLKESDFDRHRRRNVPNNVLETWSISIDRIGQESPTAYKILHVIAYLSNENIPHEIVMATLKHGDECPDTQPDDLEIEADKAIMRLKELSFIGIREIEDGRSYEMHKLVQEATRYGLKMKTSSVFEGHISGKESERYFSSIALQVMMDIFPESEQETWAQCEKYLTHAIQIGEWSDLSEEQGKTATLLFRVSLFLFHRGRWREKELVDERVLKLQREAFGERHLDTIRAIAQLAITYSKQGRYSEAEPLQIKVLNLRQEILGERHPDTIWAIGSLASTYHAQGRYSEAEPLKIQVLDLRQEILGERHPDTIMAMHNLAVIYHEQGQYSKAEHLKIQVLDLRQEILRERHPDTIWAIGSLASTYHAQGRYSEAEPLDIQVLDLRREVLGERHPDTIWAIGDLAVTYHAQGRYSEAEPLEIQALDLQREVLGERHPDTIWAIGNLAVTYYKQGRYSEAEPLEIQALDLRREVLGERHPDTITAMHNLACTWHEIKGRDHDALSLMQQCVEYRRSVLGLDHPFTVLSAETLESWKR